MQLIIDIGNSSVKYYYAGQVFSSLEDLPSSLRAQRSNPPIGALIISSVPEKNNIEQDNFIIWVGDKEAKVQIYDPLKDSKLKGLYPGIGADRIAKLEAARILYPSRDIILFDFGTATTMSVANTQAEFLGGFISLGLSASLKTLANCAELPDLSGGLLSINEPDGSFMRFKSRVQNPGCHDINLAKSTNEAILSGAILAHDALIDSWLKSARVSTNQALTIATGGDRELFKSKFDLVISAAELLCS